MIDREIDFWQTTIELSYISESMQIDFIYGALSSLGNYDLIIKKSNPFIWRTYTCICNGGSRSWTMYNIV